MMITNLPNDLMEDILSRVPIKSMRPVRLTCTKWNTISKSQIFAKMHFDKAFDPANEDEYESRMIGMMETNLYLLSVFVNVNDVIDFSAEEKGKLTCLNEQVKISHVFHSEGVLLCILEDDDTRVVVWNPYLGQTRWIQLRYSHVVPPQSQPRCMFRYGIGYEAKGSGRNYKILRFVDVLLYEEEYEFLWYEIYDFESGLWMTLDVTDPHWCIKKSHHGVSVKGNTYWCATERNLQGCEWECGRKRVNHIICFDYSRMRFGPLLPLPLRNGYYRVDLSCVREEKLAALCSSHEDEPYYFSIWILTMLEAGNVSWSKFFTFNQDSLPHDIRFSSFWGFYIDHVKKVAMFSGRRSNHYAICIINEEGEYAGEVALEECTDQRYWGKSVCCYVPSLVQIKEPQGGQRQKQSDLEKFRYDEMMSRLTLFRWRCATLDPFYLKHSLSQ
ncbi:unnamed protein product [Microthlaspi erraticum]|uniref:F-box domain-containing protein n=1 Tax=Microthlaspi erraticum TaxID=1685480 RepID=A0A6D2KIV3_9BRAS|nr:unnamed protein product [Microthlaspi erraticum]